MAKHAHIAIGEWYHCYNRGVDKRKVFETQADYKRFLLLLFLCNASKRMHVSDLSDKNLARVLSDARLAAKRGDPLVEIAAFSLMPNHFHLALKENVEGGIALFMQKVLTGYTMYFNKKNERTGALFAGTFKAKHVDDDRYFKKLIGYIHANAAELVAPKWKEGVGNPRAIEKFLLSYPYASVAEFMSRLNLDNTQGETIISSNVSEYFDSVPSIRTMLEDARAYYAEFSANKI